MGWLEVLRASLLHAAQGNRVLVATKSVFPLTHSFIHFIHPATYHLMSPACLEPMPSWITMSVTLLTCRELLARRQETAVQMNKHTVSQHVVVSAM